MGLPLIFLVDRFYSSTFAYTLAAAMEGGEEAVKEVHDEAEDDIDVDNGDPSKFVIQRWLASSQSFSCGQKICSGQTFRSTWLSMSRWSMVMQMKKTTTLILTTSCFQARRGRVEERNRQEASKSNDWDDRMAREEMLARRINQLLQRVDVPQVGLLRTSLDN